ncbi:MAG TPA: hypothetical protein VMT18_12775, partial [Planctomycetota bacterium]|nr:hypothetical protein [Planctomycetota bacterium]
MLALALTVLALARVAAPEIRLERWPDGKPKAEYEVRIEADGSEVRHGSWKTWFENGKQSEEGSYADGRRVGDWSLRWPDGKRRALGAYVDGLRDGPWKHYHESGPKSGEGSYTAGRRSGEWRFWTSDRALDEAQSGVYEPVDRTIGECGVTVQGTTVGGRPMGLWVWRRADGSLRFAGAYGPDGPEGPWAAVLADGSLDAQQSGEYAAGV